MKMRPEDRADLATQLRLATAVLIGAASALDEFGRQEVAFQLSDLAGQVSEIREQLLEPLRQFPALSARGEGEDPQEELPF
ncbi:MAG TPA: hypothetical protein VFE26_13545 [Trebonia sp.]|nr:hypothetical protein [Trebonia sp.]